MQYAQLGNTGITVSRICLGCMTYGSPDWGAWVLDEEQSLPSIAAAWEAGINFFDTADIYSNGQSERILGKAIEQIGMRRAEVVVATKAFFPMAPGRNDGGLSRKHLLHAIDASLDRLGLDHVDLFQIHRFDYITPIEETMSALGEIVRSGKALHVGASSMYAWQFQKMQHTADALGVPRFVTMQNHYNLAYREEEREMNPLCVDLGVGLIPWSPLARGLLAGGRRPSDDGGVTADTTRATSDSFSKATQRTSDLAVAEAVCAVAAEQGVPPARVALAWLLQRPGVVAPIVGTSKPHHLDAAVAAFDLTLDADQVWVLAATGLK